MKPLKDCPNCGASITPSLTQPHIECEFCHSQFANPQYDPARSRPPTADAQKGFPPPRAEIIEPEPFVKPAKDIGGSLIKSFVAAVSWYILAPILFVGFFLVFGCCFLWFAAKSHDRVRRPDEHAIRRQKSEKTRESVEQIAKQMRAEMERQGEIFNDDQGAKYLADKPNDGWDHPLRYEQVTNRRFLVRSSGEDGVYATYDDRIYTQSVASSCITKTPPAIGSFDEAKKVLQDSIGFYRKSVAIDWIVANQPKMSAKETDRVISLAIESATFASQEGEKQVERLVVALISENEPNRMVEKTLACGRGGYVNAAKSLIDLMGKRDQKKAVEGFYNSPVEKISNAADYHLQKWKYSDEQMIQLCLTDLNNSLTRNQAIDRLMNFEVAEQRKSAIGKAVLKSLRDVKPVSRFGRSSVNRLETKEVKRFLAKFVDRELVPDLCRTLSESSYFTEELAQALADLRDPKGMQKLADMAMEPGAKSSRCRKVLVNMGVDAEPYIWKILENGSDYDKQKACEMLGSVGTKRSIEYLTPLLNSDNARLRSAATQAIRNIESAKRAPSGAGKR